MQNLLLGTGIIPAKGLQYPFPSHPPMQPLTPTSISTPTGQTTSLTTPVSTSTTHRGSSHGDNRLKSCVSAPSDNRTSSKVIVNRSVSSSLTVSNLTQIKSSDNAKNIPVNSSDLIATTLNTNLVDNNKSNKNTRDSKNSDNKNNERVVNRRDSSCSSSPRSDLKTRRNSDCGIRKNEEEDADIRKEREEKEQLEIATLENDRLEKERLEHERLEKERIEREEREKLEKEQLEREKLEKERLERERLEYERQERERIEKERIEREKRREREDRERREREEREREEQLEKERQEKEKRERERKEREEQEKREREEQLERERLEKERRERKEKEEKERREREDKERKERIERLEHERKEKEERERQEKEEQLEKERIEKERLEKENERKREKEEERKHKVDNHDKRKDDYRHQIQNEKNHKENNIDTRPEKYEKQNSKDNTPHESRNNYDKNKHTERRKEMKETKENNIHDKTKTLVNEIREGKDRPVIESRHLSIDLDKNRQYENNSTNLLDPLKRKERNNSLPAIIGSKRRVSSHEENPEDIKRIKLNLDHKKVSERRDSKDSRDEKSKNKHKNSLKPHDDKSRHDKYNNIRENERNKDKEKEDRHKSKQLKPEKVDKQKIKTKCRDKDGRELPSTPKSPGKEITLDKDFLARLDLMEVEKQKQQRKEIKEKRKQDCFELNDEQRKSEEKRNEERRKHLSLERKRDDLSKSTNEERKMPKKERIRKSTHSSDNTDSDEPKKHSIFDIVDDEPAYISMYDKVKARSCKNMQKQEEEKRQEKIKAKFSQLKQSRAKREEKKRSTSWDEDSESDRERDNKCDLKGRGRKMLIASSDDDDDIINVIKKKDIYSDSESERRHIKSEQAETSDDDSLKQKSIQRKGSKSRITSDTSDDEFKKIQSKIKSEIFSDHEDESYMNCVKKIKDEFDESLVKREKPMYNKHQDSLVEQLNSQIFGDSNLSIHDIKSEKGRRIFPDISSADESENRRDKNELRKKHKKKQKRQKSFNNDDSLKMDSSLENIQIDDKKMIEKKKTHSKKEKKRDKCKDEDKVREKSKKSKKSRDQKNELKHEGKMVNIFGSLSDDSETGNKEKEIDDHKQTSVDRFSDDNIHPYMCASDSDSFSHIEKEVYKMEDKERQLKEHRKRKEKRRRDKEKRMREEQLNDNSMDYIDMGKQLEDNIKDDSEIVTETKTETEEHEPEIPEEVFKFDAKDQDRKENKEKKKKRKKSKEEKQRHHHHHHHHDKSKTKSLDNNKKEPHTPDEIKSESETQSASLPNILDIPSPPSTKSSPNLDLSPVIRSEQMISPIPKTPTSSKDKKRDKLIPGFGTEIDEKLHDSAIKSISEFESPKVDNTKEITIPGEGKTEKNESSEKPRVVISQEETEDAVAALLGESFGEAQFEECYNEADATPTDQEVHDENTQDDEEMRQAVQSLNSSELEMKPDTPQSEHELQIDTDTEEQEDMSLRYDQPPRTPDIIDINQPPKTPDIPSCYRRDEVKSVVNKAPAAAIASPPSLTPIKSSINDVKRNLDTTTTEKIPDKPIIPSLPEQSRTVISQNWKDDKVKIQQTPPPIKAVQANEVKAQTSCVVASTTITTTSTPIPHTSVPHTSISHGTTRIYTTATPPVIKLPELPPLKISEPNVQTASVKEDNKLQNAPKVQPTLVTKPLLHNMPAQMPYPVPFSKATATSDNNTNMQQAKVSSLHNTLSRLPITPILSSKAMQAARLILAQSKVALSQNPNQNPNTTSELKLSPIQQQQERSRIYSTAAYSSYMQTPRMVVHPSMHLQRPQGLLVPTKPNTFGYAQNLPPTTYGMQQQNQSHMPSQLSDLPKLVPTTPHVTSQNHSVNPQQPPTIIITSHAQPVHQKPFMPVIQETPKLVNLPPSSNSDIRVSHSSIIQQAPKPTSTPDTKDSAEYLRLSKEITRTSTPSPVIITPPNKEPLPVSNSDSKNISIKPSPIELVTEELNLSLKKEDPIPVLVPEKVEIKNESEKKEVVTLQNPVEKEITKPSNLTINPIEPDPYKFNCNSSIRNVEINKPVDSDKPITAEVNRDVKPATVIEEKVKSEEKPIKSDLLKTSDVQLHQNPETKPVILDNKLGLIEKSNCVEKSTIKTTVQDVEMKTGIDNVKQEELPIQPNKESETVSVIKEVEKFDDEKVDPLVSRKVAVTIKDDPLDSKDDGDYWSAKEINIDSVIKKLCSADELSDKNSEPEKLEWFNSSVPSKTIKEPEPATTPDTEKTESVTLDTQSANFFDLGESVEEERDTAVRGGRRGGRARGRKPRGFERGGMQTRRGKVIKEGTPTVTATPISRRGRGGRMKSERKINKSESETADVYEFRDDSDENNTNKDRPRLILTIKSPTVNNTNSNNITQAVVKEVAKETVIQTKLVESKEEFVSPVVANTRKSRRLQEKDVSRNTVDDTIEDVVKNTMVTRSATNIQGTRRSARQTTKVIPETPRKSPRGVRKKDRRASDVTDDEEKPSTVKAADAAKASNESEIKNEKPLLEKEQVVSKEIVREEPKVEPPTKEKPHEGLKAAVLRRVKGEMNQEPMTLIDPVTGELTPMRECEEGRYIPVAGQLKAVKQGSLVVQQNNAIVKPKELEQPQQAQPTVIATAQPTPVLKSQKPQSLKAHVLSCQAAKAVVSQQQQQLPKVVIPVSQSPVLVNKSLPVNQNLNVNVNLPNYAPTHLSPHTVPMNVVKPSPAVKLPPPLSPNQMLLLTHQQKQMAQTKQQTITKPLTIGNVNPVVTSQILTKPQNMKQQQQQQVLMNKNLVKPHNLQQQLLTNAVSTPSMKPQPQVPSPRVVQTLPNSKAMEPPKVEVSIAGCVMVPRASPQAQNRHVLQTGIPVPAYEANLVSSIYFFSFLLLIRNIY